MNRYRLLLVGGLIFLWACQPISLTEAANDHLFLRSGSATMPVFVRGNTQSEVFVVWLHGGPGYTSIEGYQAPENPLTALQEDYTVVYWEQRCAGSSQGNCRYQELSFDQYTQDLAALLSLLRQQYGTDIQFFLMGHSWGGTLGIQYLADPDTQSEVSGWIEVDGGHDVPRIAQLEREMLVEVGTRQIRQGHEVETWIDLLEQAELLDLSITDDVFAMNRLARRAEGLMNRVDSVADKVGSFRGVDYFFSPLDLHAMPQNGERTIEALQDELVLLSRSEETRLITIPTLMIWGRYDFRVPPTFAEEAFVRYGSLDKELVIFEQSAHFPYLTEPNRFLSLVTDFIETHR